MVAGYRKDAVLAFQTVKRVNHVFHVQRLSVNEIAGNNDEIGIQVVNHGNDSFEPGTANDPSHVDIGNLCDAQAFQLAGQIWHPDLKMCDANPAGLDQAINRDRHYNGRDNSRHGSAIEDPTKDNQAKKVAGHRDQDEIDDHAHPD